MQFNAPDDGGGRGQTPVKERAINAPLVVIVLGAIMVLIHILFGFLSPERSEWALLAFAFIPLRYAGGAPDLPGGPGADYWTFLSHMFLHGDWMHLIFNVLFMVAFGSVLARRFGAVRFLAFSALAGIAGALAHLLAYWGEFVPVIGASGAISGQMAGAVRLLFSDRGDIFSTHRMDIAKVRALRLRELITSRRALTFLGVWILIMVATGAGNMFAPGGVSIAWQAHLGGFFAGLLLFELFDPLRRAPVV